MTPPPAAAATPAVRPRSAPGRAVRAPAPRRVSGPAKRKTTTAATAAPRARTYTPARGGAIALPAPGGLAASLLEVLAGLSRQRLLDRLIRGRAWIGLLAFALIGIVAMQLWVVKLGVGIGRALEHEGLLQRENATLSIEDAQLSSGERVEQMAAARGMVVAAPGALRFESVRGGLDAREAAAALARGGQVASADTNASTATTSGASSEASASQSASTTAEASTETPAGSATGSTAGTGEGSTGASEAAAAPGEGTTPASGTSSAAGAAPASAEGAASTSTATSVGGATSASGEATPVSGTGAVGAEGGTQQPVAGG